MIRPPDEADFSAAPFASPVGNGSDVTFGPVRGQQGSLTVPNDRSTSVLRRRLGRRRVARLAEQLSERDKGVLVRVGEHGFLTTDQVQRFVFTGHRSPTTAERTSRRVLQRLARDGLLRALPRRQGGPLAGSTPACWQLTAGGSRIVLGATNYRPHLPSTRFLQHCLAVAETHLEILSTAAAAGLVATISVEVKGWQTYTGQGGEQLLLKPDMTVRLSGSDKEGAFIDYWLVEVDCGTESVPALLRKCEQYRAYHASGIWASTFGVMPRVLWVMDKAERVRGLTAALKRRRNGTIDLFRATTLDQLHDELKGGDS